MPTNVIDPDTNDHVQFRKSIYDDDADQLSLDSVEVVQTNLTPHDPPLTPAWLTYTTATETTAEGPASERTYLHVDFDIDLAALADNDTVFIRIVASDGPHTIEQTFRFMKGNLQMSDIPGCVIWMKPEKEDPRPSEGSYYSPTNFGTGADLVREGNGRFRRDLLNGRDGFESDDGFIYQDLFFSTEDGLRPYSVFVVAQPASGRTTDIIRLYGGEYGLEIQWDGYNEIEYRKEYPGGSDNHQAESELRQNDAFGLVEYHKRPDGTVYVMEKGEVKIQTQDTDPFSALNPEFMYTRFSCFGTCVVGYDADLTNAQVEAIRKRLWQEYQIDMQNLEATQFG